MDFHAFIKQAYKDSVNDNKFDKNMQWTTPSSLLFTKSNKLQIIVGNRWKKGPYFLKFKFWVEIEYIFETVLKL